MGIRIPENTMRQNQYSLRAFSPFVTDYPGFAEEAFKKEEHLRSYVMDDPECKLRWQLEETRKHVFPGLENVGHLPPDYED